MGLGHQGKELSVSWILIDIHNIADFHGAFNPVVRYQYLVGQSIELSDIICSLNRDKNLYCLKVESESNRNHVLDKVRTLKDSVYKDS